MPRWLVHPTLLAGLMLVLTACAVAETPVPRDPDPAPRAGLLDGPADAPALEHTEFLHVPREVDPGEVSADPAVEDREVLRTEIEVLFREDVTVGEVNALLEAIDGSIVGMTPGVPSYAVRIPDPGSLAALRSLITEIEARPEVLLVLEAVLVRPEPVVDGAESVTVQVLPPGLGLDAIDRIDNHLAVRGHAAWNARAALPSLGTRPWFLIADLFGDGPPNHDYDVGLVADDFADVAQTSEHGYHVLGIATAYFGESGGTLERNRITGMFPNSLRVRAADVLDNAVGTTWVDLPVMMLARMGAALADDPGGRVVINTSLNSRALTATEREQRALLWAWRLRAAGLVGRTVHLTSAGNIRFGATWPAEENSIFAKAALSDTEFTIVGVTLRQDRLTNTLVVENRVNTAATVDERPLPGCLNGANHGGTQLGGTISAMGTQVWAFLGPDEAAGADTKTGTSMATPQVAGLAAFVWSLDPTLTAQGIVALLLDTARAMAADETAGFPCHDDTGTPVIDAYDAVLAAGGEAIRRALLDVTGDGAFREDDLTRFVAEFAARDGALDFSRFDLNGSGRTGGSSTERFDLDASGTFGMVTQSAPGATLAFDETAVTDVEVLCYYAFSPLYQGDEAERFRLMGSSCGVLPIFFYPPDGLVIRTIDPGTLTLHGVEYPTLPKVEFWSPAPPPDALAYYRELEALGGWSWDQLTAEEPPRDYLFEWEVTSEFAGLPEAWSRVTPSVMVRAAVTADGLPPEARTVVRVAYAEVAPPH
jgi:subtilisin family serine protease